MENREIEKFEQAYNYWITDKLDDGTFSTLVYNFISKHKNTLDEIEMLKFQLKAADSVNEGLSKANEEIIELLEGNGVTNTNWILNRLKELTNQNK